MIEIDLFCVAFRPTLPKGNFKKLSVHTGSCYVAHVIQRITRVWTKVGIEIKIRVFILIK